MQAHPPFLNEVVTKGAFLCKVHPPICAVVHGVMLSKKHQRSSTLQEEGLINEGRHHLLLLHKQVHYKRSIAELLHAYITRARQTACEVGIFSREISQLSQIHPPPSLRSHLSSSPMGVLSRDYSIYSWERLSSPRSMLQLRHLLNIHK